MPQFWLQYCPSPSFIYCFIFGLNPKKTYVTPGWLTAHRGEKEKNAILLHLLRNCYGRAIKYFNAK